MNSWVPAGIAPGIPEHEITVALLAALHHLVHTAALAAGVEVPVVVGALAELSDLDQHGESGGAQRVLQARRILDVRLLGPSDRDRAVRSSLDEKAAAAVCTGRPA